MLDKLFAASIVALYIFTNATLTHAKPTSAQAIGYCIEAGRDNRDTDEEITERCIPSGDSLEDYE